MGLTLPLPRYGDEVLELTTTGVAKGGEAIARDADGRVVFVRGALPGERVLAEVREAKRDFARAEVAEVLEASPWRVEPPCPMVAAGCGGCDLQHASLDGQRAVKRTIVEDALRRGAKLPDHPPVRVVPLPGSGYRTTVKALVHDGRVALRRHHSHDAVVLGSCLVAHPLLDELVADGRFGAADAVTLRCGARTGERLVVVSPNARDVRVPDGVVVVGADELRDGHRAEYHEIVAGVSFRVSADAFFQARADGADALVQVVGELAAPDAGDEPWRRAADLYAGVGLFAATVLSEVPEVLAVESNRAAVRDGTVNAPRARWARVAMERWRPEPVDLVVADPARAGLGREAARRVAATGASRVVLVSCDPASFARDVALLVAAGYGLDDVVAIDLFPHTSHVEVVSRFSRRPDVVQD